MTPSRLPRVATTLVFPTHSPTTLLTPSRSDNPRGCRAPEWGSASAYGTFSGNPPRLWSGATALALPALPDQFYHALYIRKEKHNGNNKCGL